MRTAVGTPLFGILAAGLASLAIAVAASPAAAQNTPMPVGPWDGQNPFNCLNQDVGEGTDFPDPGADPFCVEFDKRSQNVTDFGIVDFFSKEPARVAAASSKCFYFQRDHWTGSIVQGSDPELWNWDGSYFFDRAKGVGGAHLSNFRIGGTPQDATPYVPPQYHPYLSETGGGGALVLLESEPDPSCGALVDTPAEREQIYGDEPLFRDCVAPGGRVGARRIGRVRLGLSRDEVWRRLGSPDARGGGSHRWCVTGGSSLRVGFHERARNGSGAPRGVALVRSTNPGHEIDRIGPGSRRARALRRLGLTWRLDLGRTEVFATAAERRRQVLVGIRARRVKWLALADPNRLPTSSALRSALRNPR